MVLLPKNVFSALVMRFFWQKNQKTLTLEKLENIMNKECFFREKTF